MEQSEIIHLQTLDVILQGDIERIDADGNIIYSKFGVRSEYDISRSFPMMPSAQLDFDAIVHDILWTIRGDTNIKYLQDNNVTIWDEYADNTGYVGITEGSEWTKWGKTEFYMSPNIDQLENLIKNIKNNPHSKKHLLLSWNVIDVRNMYKCPHQVLLQFYVQDDTLSCQLYERSSEMYQWAPYSVAKYSLLTCMIAHVTGLTPKQFIHIIGDAYIYKTNVDNVKDKLEYIGTPYPTLMINSLIIDILEFKHSDFNLFAKSYTDGLTGLGEEAAKQAKLSIKQ